MRTSLTRSSKFTKLPKNEKNRDLEVTPSPPPLADAASKTKPNRHRRHVSDSHSSSQGPDSALLRVGCIRDDGGTFSPEEALENYKKRGLCPICGKVKTHEKKFFSTHGMVHMEPQTRPGEVLEGFCLRCYTKEDIMNKPEVISRLSLKNSPSLGTRERMKDRYRRYFPNSIDDSISDGALSSMTSLVSEAEALEQVYLPQGVDDIVQYMGDNGGDVDIQLFGCRELIKLYKDKNVDVDAHVTDAIVRAMDHVKNKRIQKEGCQALRIFTTELHPDGSSSDNEQYEINDLFCQYLEAQGGIYVILTAMRAHRDSKTIFGDCMRVIRNICTSSSESCKPAIVEMHGVELILSAMKLCKNMRQIQEDGCLILWCVACDNDYVQDILLKKDAVNIILEGMTYHLDDKNVQHRGCGALHVMSFNNDLKPMMIFSEKVDVITKAATRHKSSEDVIQMAFGTLANLEQYIIEHMEGSSDASKLSQAFIEFVLNSMQTHSKSRPVQISACCLLEMASNNSSYLEIITKNPNVLFEVVHNFPEECERPVNSIMEAVYK